MSSRLLSLALALGLGGHALLGSGAVAPALAAAPAPRADPAPQLDDEEQETLRPGRYAVDAGHSMGIFSIRHMGVANFYGRFNNVTGELSLDLEDPARSTVKIDIDPTSVDTNDEKRDAHVRSPDFLDAAAHPELGFVSRSVTRTAADRFEVTGELSLAGVTRQLTTEVVIVGAGDTFFGDYRMGAEARFAIDRRDFDMEALQGGLGNRIDFIVSLETIQLVDDAAGGDGDDPGR